MKRQERHIRVDPRVPPRKSASKGYEILPHTADLRIRIQAKTLKGLFKNALLGLAHVLAGDLTKGSPVKAESVEISSSSPTALLIDFLNEVLYLSNVNKAVYEKLEIKRLRETDLKGTLEGYSVGGFSEDVKAITYHGAEIKKDHEGHYEVEILLDI